MEFSNLIELAAACGAGSAITTIVDRFFSRKKDNADIATEHLSMAQQVNTMLQDVIKQLQEISCYHESCKKRINGKS